MMQQRSSRLEKTLANVQQLLSECEQKLKLEIVPEQQKKLNQRIHELKQLLAMYHATESEPTLSTPTKSENLRPQTSSLVIYSRYDTANKLLYPLGMSFKVFAPLEQRYEIGGDEETKELYNISQNPFGALGANGAQGLNQGSYHAIELQARDVPYVWGNLNSVSCLNVDGQQFINEGNPPAGAHNDNEKYEIFYLALALSLR